MRTAHCRLLATGAAFLALTFAAAVSAQTPKPPDPTGDVRGDLKVFSSRFIDTDVSFSPAAREAARARLRALDARLDGLSPLEVQVELCRIAALANNAHSGCSVSDLPAPGVGLGFYAIEGELYVFLARATDADLIGGRLLAIDGQPVEAVRATVRTMQGGRPGWRDLLTAYVYGSPAILHALGVTRAADVAAYRIRTPGGRVIERRLAAPAPAGPNAFVLTPPRSPWSWRDMADPFRWRDAPEHGAMIVQLRSNFDHPGRPMAAFLDEVERQRAALGRKTVIVDMRSNDGGDMTLSRDFFAAWPDRVGAGARFLVLLGPRSLSAGLADVAYLKQAGGSEVTILGGSPGDGMTFFSEGGLIRLPGTGLVVRNALERDDLKDGCRPYTDCHAGFAQPGGPTATPPERAAFLKRMPVAVATLEPDVPMRSTIQDYLAGRDAVLDMALDLATSCPRAPHPGACEAETRELAGPAPAAAPKAPSA
jgi:hypothetical protein